MRAVPSSSGGTTSPRSGTSPKRCKQSWKDQRDGAAARHGSARGRGDVDPVGLRRLAHTASGPGSTAERSPGRVLDGDGDPSSAVDEEIGKASGRERGCTEV